MRRKMLPAIVLLLTLTSPAAAQSLGERVARAPDGAVRFHFPAREGVCGYGDAIVVRRPGERATTIMGRWSSEMRGRDWENECELGPVRVELRVRGGEVVDLDTRVGGARPVRGTDLGAVEAAEAARYLLDLARTADEEVGEDAIMAATLGADVVPYPDLLRLAADARVPEGTREKAVFWAAESGAPVSELSGLYRRVAETDVREQILFAYSRRDEPAAVRELLRVARGDEPEKLRKTAVFWLGQAAGREVTRDLEGIVEDESVDAEVRAHAVFALSQRPRDEAIPALIQIARESRHPELRRKAMFWLAESRDPRALALFEEILIK